MGKLKNHTIKDGEDATFVVKVIGGHLLPDIQWFHGSTLLSGSDQVMVESDGNRHSLTLQSCGEVRSGQVRVTATNQAGTCSKRAMLTVTGL